MKRTHAPAYYKKLYLSWFNDFVTVGYFAVYYDLELHEARTILMKGRLLQQDEFGYH